MNSFKAQPGLLDEQYGIERSVVESGYRRAQLNELVQNAADAMLGLEGRLQMVLTDDTLYCANEGQPFKSSGVTAIMMAHRSSKRGKEIGRYGLGFKSVLEISDRPEILSRSGSFRWSEEITQRALATAAVEYGAEHLPVLRIAEIFDPVSEAKSDVVLTEMMAWADTVVRLPLVDGVAEQVSHSIATFSGEFVLFSDSIGRLELDDRRSGTRREWRVDRLDDTTLDLHTAESHSEGTPRAGTVRWRVFSAEHHPSPRAAAFAGVRNSREELAVQWAIPADGSSTSKGQLWSHFPTASTLSVRGIVNAQFQTADDRHDIINGEYNEEILARTLPAVIASGLPEVAEPSAPSRHFGWLPSRDREVDSWADEVSNDAVMRAVATTSCFPDLDGTFRRADELLVPPLLEAVKDTELRDARDAWYALAHEESGTLAPWLHESALKNDGTGRHAKVRRLLDFAGVAAKEPRELVEGLAASRTMTGYRNALTFASVVLRSYAAWHSEVYRAAFIPTLEGRLEAPEAGRLTLPDPEDDAPSGPVVLPQVAHDPVCLPHLKLLGITGHDDEGRLRRVIRAAVQSPNAQAFKNLWETAHQLRDRRSVEALLSQSFPDPGKVFVKMLDGAWKPVTSAWRIGSVFVPSSRGTDPSLLLDDAFHGPDLGLLARWGVRQNLPDTAPLAHDPSLERAWRDSVKRTALTDARGLGYQISAGDIDLSPTTLTPGLLDLAHASTRTRERIVKLLVERQGSEASLRTTASYRTWDTRVLSPDAWWVLEYGVAETPLGALPVEHCTSGQEVASSFPREFLPIPHDLGHFARPVLTPMVTAKAWDFLFGTVVDAMRNLTSVHRLYAHAATQGARRPARLRALDKDERRFVESEFCVVTSRKATTDHLLTHQDVGVIQVDDEALARALGEKWSLDVVDIAFDSYLPEDSYDSPVHMAELHPHIGVVDPRLKRLRVALADSVLLRTTNDFDDVVVEDVSKKARFLRAQELLVVDRELKSNVLQYALRAVDSSRSVEDARLLMRKALEDARLKEASAKQNEWEKLLAYFGADSINAVVPQQTRAMVEEYLSRELSAKELFEVAKAMYGADVVRQLSKSLQERGDAAGPTRFSGSRDAKDFVEQLGIDPEFAGERYVRLPAQEVVTGPVRLKPLHPFQEDVSGLIRDVLSGQDDRRAMVQLPTGAGKTRVAVESVVRHVAGSEEPLKGHVMWIAQTKELCEQAVGTWMAVWRAHGSENTDMVVSRFWDGNPREVVTQDAGLHVIVSTPATAARMFESTKAKDGWFQRPGIVIIDEAHGAEARTTKQMLSRFKRRGTARTPVLGLSATPYRGTDERSTESLVEIFDRNLLTPSQFGPDDATQYLQANGYLSQVDHHILDGIALPKTRAAQEVDEEISSPLTRMSEAQLDLAAVARSTERNNQIIRSILSRGEDQRTLLFAASVQHAHALAAVFSYEGIESVAVHADMSPGARRAAVERFRRGDLKVLTNFNVLSQGFDVPDVSAVYVCRPTFVPNRYLQMIGRGLRGPQNGGTERVDIVNVQDNADNFGTKLAFTHFDHLWSKKVPAGAAR
ncbi:sacsin N-terminal ATP-binding-like domain-containing protein [Brachybacterium fresconis]|uniref:Superfamily II DNA or RNA helicase n=1 Tax=Brachybacterium fresconis TaxID=173363 RepID=A0ABS4YLX2_9MICO|nr:superfamily II DNA or RNA helicase [Brachybacterium fresconis]